MSHIPAPTMRTLHGIPVFLLLIVAPVLSQQVTFTAVPQKPGGVIHEESTFRLDMVLSVDAMGEAMTFDVSNEDQHTRTMRVRETLGFDITTFTVEYSAYSSASNTPQGATSVKGPVIGRVYLLYRPDSVKTIGADDGKPVSETEEAYLMKEFRKQDFSERMNKVLDGRTFSVGDTLVLSHDLAMSFVSKGSENDVKDFSIRLAAVRMDGGTRLAVFAVRLVVEGENEGMVTTLTMEGEMVVDVATCWPRTISVTGPMTMEGQAQGMPITGEGTMKGTKVFSYEK